MAWWLLAPVVVGLGKVIYDAVTEESSSSTPSSNYSEQKRKAEEQAQREQKEKENIERKNKLISILVDGVNTHLNKIKKDFLINPNHINFKVNNVDKLTRFTEHKFDNNAQTALVALSILTDNELSLKNSKLNSKEKEKLTKESVDLQALEEFLTNELRKAS